MCIRDGSYGGIVLHDVIHNAFAHKAIEKGADGVIAVAAGAGGHAGVQSPFALIQEIREWFDGPLLLSGAIAHGRSLLAAQAAGADLVVFPELSLTGYFLRDMVPEVALHRSSLEIAQLIEAASPMAIVAGFVEEAPGHQFFNAAFYAEAGRLLHVHRKVYLPTYGLFEEQRYFSPGKRFQAFYRRILEHARRVASITRQISTFSSPTSPLPELLDVNALLDNICAFIRYDRRYRRIDLVTQLDRSLPAAVAVAGANLTTQILKYRVFERDDLLGLGGWNSTNTLPSGHTTVAAAGLVGRWSSTAVADWSRAPAMVC